MSLFGRWPYRLALIAMFAMALHAAGARAGDPATPMFSLSGFGTFGLTHSSEKGADFTSSVFKPNGAGYSRAWSADVDRLLGVQVTAEFTPQLSAILQVMSEQNYDNTYRPHVEWGNIKYQLTPDISIRGGRVVLPVFLVSDYRKVGFATPWVRPPVELYSLIPISNTDGADASYRVRFGEFTNTVRGTYGKSEPKLPSGGTAKGKELGSIAYTGDYGAFTARIAYLRAKLTVEASQPLFEGFRQFGSEGVALADKYELRNKPVEFIGLGASYDPGGWFVMGEWGFAKSPSAFGRRTAWYASGGYRLGKVTPYLTYAQAKANSNTSDPGLTLSALPPFLAEPAAGLNAGLNAILGSAPEQKTVSVGARWDFAKNTALKLQFDQTRLGAGSHGTLINLQPGFQPGGKFNVFSATIDFVF